MQFMNHKKSNRRLAVSYICTALIDHVKLTN